MFDNVLIANRGEIALPRACAPAPASGIRTVAVFTDADRAAPHVREADEAVRVPATSTSTPSSRPRRRRGAQAIHPGYGFLSERAGVRRAPSRRPGSCWSGRPPR